MTETIQTFDEAILFWIQQNLSHSPIQSFFSKLTTLNDHGFLTFAIILFIILYKKDNKVTLVCICATIVSLVVVQLGLKNIIARPRPFETLSYLTLYIQKPTTFSFPSGHASISSIAFGLSYLYIDIKWLRNLLMTITVLIAISRVIIKVHYLTDVLAGFAIATIIVYVTNYFFKN